MPASFRPWPLLALAPLLALPRPARADAPPPDFRHAEYEVHPPWINRPNYGNLLRDAEVTAIGETGSQHAYFANKGRPAATWDYWAYAALPAWIDFKMPELRPVAEIRVWMPVASGPRVYQYCIEGSTYNKDWQMLADCRHNTALATLDPVVLPLAHPAMVRYLRLTVTGNSKPDEGARIWQVEAFAQPAPLALAGAVGSIDRRYDGDTVPLAAGAAAWAATAWRGERASGQFVVWSESDRDELRAAVSPLRGPGGAELPAGAARTFFVRHVMADGHYTGDVLDTSPRLDLPAGTYRPIWLTIDVPRDAAPGRYTGTLTVCADDGGEHRFPLALDVLPATLPAPAQWSFFLDIMQNPWTIAAWHGVAPWSEEHFRLMRPYLAMLADAGQKCITTTIVDRPWNMRDYTDYRSMVEHIREPDGAWRFDYTLFDRYVELCMSFGIDRQIGCDSLLTWSGCFAYTDAATGAERNLNAAPGSKAYEDYWRPFLRDFERHLAAKGWLDRTVISIDEPAPESVRAIADLVRINSPHIHFSIACNEAPSNFHGLDAKDFTVILMQAGAELEQDIAARTAAHRTTTFYVCMDPLRPNTFVNSPPAESVWLGYYTAVTGFSGMERWAFTNWPRAPFSDTAYCPTLGERVLPAGDCFLVYPGPLSSIRWEMVRAGIVEWEKLRWLREHHHGALPAAVDSKLQGFRDPVNLGSDEALARRVDAMRDAVNQSARETEP